MPSNAPTNLIPADGAETTTLTPTFQGTHTANIGAMVAAYIEVRRVSDNAAMWISNGQAASGATFSLSYGGTPLVKGVQYNWRAATEATGEGKQGTFSAFQGFTAGDNAAPTANIVSPSGGAQIATLTPTLTWGFNDPDTGDTQASWQVQVQRQSDSVVMWDPGVVTGADTSVVYAGTALASGTAYRWRIRAQDNHGAWSEYSAWAVFTPANAPDRPTGITPSGLTNTLTPTIGGTYVAGLGGTLAAFQYEISRGGSVIYLSGDVTASGSTFSQVYGSANSGDTPSTPPALAWGTTYTLRVRTKDNIGVYSAWTNPVTFNTNSAPSSPTNLGPNGSITGDTTPELAWSHNDADGDAQTVAEVELRKVSDDSVVTGYGPKTLTQAGTTHTVTETLIASPPTDYKWRVRTKGTAGPGFGAWSSWVSFTVAPAPTVTLTDPTPAEVLTSPTVAIAWTFSGGSGTQQDYQVKVFASDGTTPVYTGSVVVSAATSVSVNLAAYLANGGTYQVQVVARDTASVAGESSKVAITTAWTPPATITGLSATAIGGQS